MTAHGQKSAAFLVALLLGIAAGSLRADRALATGSCSKCGLGTPAVWGYPNQQFPQNVRTAGQGYPLIQICPGPTEPHGATRPASGGEPGLLAGPDCVFAGLYLDVETHPSPLSRIREVTVSNYPPGTWISPLPISFPNYDCPLRFRVHLPPTTVNCSGFQFLGLTVRTYFEFCDGQGAGSSWRSMGYFLLCAKPEFAAKVLANQPGWVNVPYLSPEFTRMYFAVANADQFSSHTINLELDSDQQSWVVQLAPPAQITLGPMQSMTIPVDVEIPSNTPLGTAGHFALSASFADGPSPIAQDVSVITIGDDLTPPPVSETPLNSLTPLVPAVSAEILMGLIFVLGAFGLVTLRRWRAGSPA